MAIQTDSLIRQLLMLRACLSMDLVAGKASHRRLSKEYHVPHILQDMAIRRVQLLEMGIRPVNLEIPKQIITWYKIVGKGQLRTARLT